MKGQNLGTDSDQQYELRDFLKIHPVLYKMEKSSGELKFPSRKNLVKVQI